MKQYPHGLPHVRGEKCPYCCGKKAESSKLCKRCNPVFQSYTAAMNWATAQEAGPCVLAYRDFYLNEGYGYADWPRKPRALPPHVVPKVAQAQA